MDVCIEMKERQTYNNRIGRELATLTVPKYMKGWKDSIVNMTQEQFDLIENLKYFQETWNSVVDCDYDDFDFTDLLIEIDRRKKWELLSWLLGISTEKTRIRMLTVFAVGNSIEGTTLLLKTFVNFPKEVTEQMYLAVRFFSNQTYFLCMENGMNVYDLRKHFFHAQHVNNVEIVKFFIKNYRNTELYPFDQTDTWNYDKPNASFTRIPDGMERWKPKLETNDLFGYACLHGLTDLAKKLIARYPKYAKKQYHSLYCCCYTEILRLLEDINKNYVLHYLFVNLAYFDEMLEVVNKDYNKMFLDARFLYDFSTIRNLIEKGRNDILNKFVTKVLDIGYKPYAVGYGILWMIQELYSAQTTFTPVMLDTVRKCALGEKDRVNHYQSSYLCSIMWQSKNPDYICAVLETLPLTISHIETCLDVELALENERIFKTLVDKNLLTTRMLNLAIDWLFDLSKCEILIKNCSISSRTLAILFLTNRQDVFPLVLNAIKEIQKPDIFKNALSVLVLMQTPRIESIRRALEYTDASHITLNASTRNKLGIETTELLCKHGAKKTWFC